VVESLGTEHDLFDIAAAAVKIAQDARDGAAKPDVEIPAAAPREERVRDRKVARGVREGGVSRSSRPRTRAGRGGDADATRIYIGIGRTSGMRPADIVGAIANEAGVNPRDIGAIDIADKFSIVEVPEGEARSIIEALRSTTLRGKRVMVREDRDR